MAKEFKHYDKIYAHLKRTDAMETVEMNLAAPRCLKWPWDVAQWPQSSVQHAVYEASDFLEWQQFRVSLKGQSTCMKLLRLAFRKAWTELRGYDNHEWRDLERCRIDNYLGALVRGGQLNSKYEVVR